MTGLRFDLPLVLAVPLLDLPLDPRPAVISFLGRPRKSESEPSSYICIGCALIYDLNHRLFILNGTVGTLHIVFFVYYIVAIPGLPE